MSQKHYWAWPLDLVSWEPPVTDDTGCVQVPVESLSRVYALEAGTVVAVETIPYTDEFETTNLIIEGASGRITYYDIPACCCQINDKVEQGQEIGLLSGGLSVCLEGDAQQALKLMVEAWARVSHRKIRDLKDIPTDPKERKELVNWIMDHPLWRHDIFIHDWEFVPTENAKYKEMKFKETGHIARLGGSFYDAVSIEYTYTCPRFAQRMHNEDLNTDFTVWVEGGGYYDRSQNEQEKLYPPKEGWTDYNKWGHYHNINLDCGGKTVEEALLRLARIVEYYYNEDGSAKDVPVPCQWIYSSEEDEVENPCEPDEEGFCKKCGYLISDYVDDSEPDESEETQE